MISRDGSGGILIRDRAEPGGSAWSALILSQPGHSSVQCVLDGQSHDSTIGTEQNGGQLSSGVRSHPPWPQEGPGSEAGGSTIGVMAGGCGGQPTSFGSWEMLETHHGHRQG